MSKCAKNKRNKGCEVEIMGYSLLFLDYIRSIRKEGCHECIAMATFFMKRGG